MDKKLTNTQKFDPHKIQKHTLHAVQAIIDNTLKHKHTL